jgi:glyoxylase-like metal-dependent hydrolase (beta-lactamase superfamily II)
MMIKIHRIQSEILGANTYIVHDGAKGVIIDPSAEPEKALEYCRTNDVSPEYIIMTHAHIDHMLYLVEYKNVFSAKDAIHEEDATAMERPETNGATLFGMKNSFQKPAITLKEGDIVKSGGVGLEVIHTPGHTPGGICLYTKGHIFSGDTLFRLSVGRADLGRGDPDALIESVREKLFTLPEDTRVHPGHGAESTIGFEKRNNPFTY